MYVWVCLGKWVWMGGFWVVFGWVGGTDRDADVIWTSVASTGFLPDFPMDYDFTDAISLGSDRRLMIRSDHADQIRSDLRLD